MSKKRRHEIMWCIKGPHGLLPWTISKQRKFAIYYHDGELAKANITYAQRRKAGTHKAVKIVVTELTP